MLHVNSVTGVPAGQVNLLGYNVTSTVKGESPHLLEGKAGARVLVLSMGEYVYMRFMRCEKYNINYTSTIYFYFPL